MIKVKTNILYYNYSFEKIMRLINMSDRFRARTIAETYPRDF